MIRTETSSSIGNTKYELTCAAAMMAEKRATSLAKDVMNRLGLVVAI